MELDISWLGEENLQKLFIEFPMPLALLNQDSGIKFANKQFLQTFHLNVLENATIQRQVHIPQGATIPITLTSSAGVPIPLLLHSISLANFTLFVLDDTPGGAPDDEMKNMRKRLAELETLSATDSLTGAWNRLPLQRIADVEIKRSMRYHHPISMIFFDIDHFKKINDTYGHKAGDEVLKALVDLVRARIRESDTIYRWGGEEFVILATATDHASAAKLAEDIRQLVEQHTFPKAERVTISLGVAEYLPGDTLEIWLHRADKAVYAAKGKGRNQVIVDPFGASDIWYQDKETMPVQLVWHDHYASGNALIDEQHFELFVQANELIKLALEDADAQTVAPQVDLVIDAIEKHFQDEERVLQEANYSDLVKHKQLHLALLDKAQNLRNDVHKGVVPVGYLLEYIAYDVIAKHILVADRNYFPSLNTGRQENGT